MERSLDRAIAYAVSVDPLLYMWYRAGFGHLPKVDALFHGLYIRHGKAGLSERGTKKNIRRWDAYTLLRIHEGKGRFCFGSSYRCRDVMSDV